MPSPFPGMDPYLESPDFWADFHNNLAPEIQAELNAQIRPRYVARLTSYMVYEAVEIGRLVKAYPDVRVSQYQPVRGEPVAPVATVAAPPVVSYVPYEEPLRLTRVEIRAVAQQQLVTVIEILSPANKRPGSDDLAQYLRKRREILHSEVHLLELDLLRAGERPPLESPVPLAPYYVMLSRADRRPQVDVWPIQVADPLPVVPVPLLAPDPDVFLDLGACFTTVYDRAAYSDEIDYGQQPPPPPLSEAEAAWVEQLLKSYRQKA